MEPRNQLEPAVIVKDLYKSFKLPHDQHSGIKQLVVNAFRGRRGYEIQHVLNDISFEVKKGEFFGIVGRNGSGKSTLLKLLSGIYVPDKGLVQVNGSLTPFIELGVGFNPELTGRENIFLNGALLGFSRSEMEMMYDDIVNFSELNMFMDQKLKNYSSGMQVRLAFSIAIRARSDILLLDEVLAVGDANFQRKCLNYFKKLKANKQTVLFISHDMAAVQEFCDRAMIVDKGRITFTGSPSEAAMRYNSLNFEKKVVVKNTEASKHIGTGEAKIEEIKLYNKAGREVSFLRPNESFSIELTMKTNKNIDGMLVGVQILDVTGTVMFSMNNKEHIKSFRKIPKNKTVHYSIYIKNIFNDGTYTLASAIKSEDRTTTYDQINGISQFEVAGWETTGGKVHVEFSTSLSVGDN